MEKNMKCLMKLKTKDKEKGNVYNVKTGTISKKKSKKKRIKSIIKETTYIRYDTYRPSINEGTTLPDTIINNNNNNEKNKIEKNSYEHVKLALKMMFIETGKMIDVLEEKDIIKDKKDASDEEGDKKNSKIERNNNYYCKQNFEKILNEYQVKYYTQGYQFSQSFANFQYLQSVMDNNEDILVNAFKYITLDSKIGGLDLGVELVRILEKNAELFAQNTHLQKQLRSQHGTTDTRFHHGTSRNPAITLDVLQSQMRDVAQRSKQLEVEHADALSALREKQSELHWKNFSTNEKIKITETIETLQSKVRELEKKIELQNVHHEELVIEMAAVKRSAQQRSYSFQPSVRFTQDTHTSPLSLPELIHHSAPFESALGYQDQIMRNSPPIIYAPKPFRPIPGPVPVTHNLSSIPFAQHSNRTNIAADVDAIMAKIEKDNRVLAELDKPRSTAMGITGGRLMHDFSRTNDLGQHSTLYGTIDPSLLPPYPHTQQTSKLSEGVASSYPPYNLNSYAFHGTGPTSLFSTDYRQIPPPQSHQLPTLTAQSYMPKLAYNKSTMNILSSLYDTEPGTRRIGNTSYHMKDRIERNASSEILRMATDAIVERTSVIDVPGKGLAHVFVATKNSYELYKPSGVEDFPDDLLTFNSGDYFFVWDYVEPETFVEAEAMDGRRGTVPTFFLRKLVGEELSMFKETVLENWRDVNHITFGGSQEHERLHSEDRARRCKGEFNLANLGNIADDEEESKDGAEEVPAPNNLTLERQLNKSILINWTPPLNCPAYANLVDSYHVYVDGLLKATVKATDRTKALLEGVDSNKCHRISVRSVTINRRTSRDAACTMLIGKDVPAYPTNLRASHVTATSATILWLPSNSNYQHTVCINNVEVRTVKPGVYRHTISGLVPNTLYRVTVRTKNIRGSSSVDDKTLTSSSDKFSAHISFQTLPKGLPDPPPDVQAEPGPQDGTLLVTWTPVTGSNANGAIVTGYAVYTDGKKVTEIDSPTADHALVDFNKIMGMNPRCITVRTKSRENYSQDSFPPVPIPKQRDPSRRAHFSTRLVDSSIPHGCRTKVNPSLEYLTYKRNINPRNDPKAKMGEKSGIDNKLMNPTAVEGRQSPPVDVQVVHRTHAPPRNPYGQVIIEPEENLSDKEVYPQEQKEKRIPSRAAILELRNMDLTRNKPIHMSNIPRNHAERGKPPAPQMHPQHQHHQQQQHQQHRQQHNQQQHNQQQRQNRMYSRNQRNSLEYDEPERQLDPLSMTSEIPADTQARWGIAMQDYDPDTMSSNPGADGTDLAFFMGDRIKLTNTKGLDGFYWGECRGRRGFVPRHMIAEIYKEIRPPNDENKRRWLETYLDNNVKRMVAIYDYDPRTASPNVDQDDEIPLVAGAILNVYGEPDDDGFYFAELNGIRGLVPSNYLLEVEEYGEQSSAKTREAIERTTQRQLSQARDRGQGPGARGPPPPPRDGMPPRTEDRRKDTLCAQYEKPQVLQGRRNQDHGHGRQSEIRDHRHQERRTGNDQILKRTSSTERSYNIQHPLTSHQMSSQMQPMTSQMQHNIISQLPQSSHTLDNPRSNYNTQEVKSQLPQMLLDPNPKPPTAPSQGFKFPESPNIMQKISDLTASAENPVDNILSKGKELIFMKFGLGK